MKVVSRSARSSRSTTQCSFSSNQLVGESGVLTSVASLVSATSGVASLLAEADGSGRASIVRERREHWSSNRQAGAASAIAVRRT